MVFGGETVRRRKISIIAITTTMLILTLSMISSVSAYGAVAGWGRVGRDRGEATLTIQAGSLSGHEEVAYVLLEVNGVTYGWEITKVKECRTILVVFAKSLGGHEALGVQPGPGRLTVLVKNHGTANAWVIAGGRNTFFMAK